MSAEAFNAELAAKPESLTGLANVLARRDPFMALPSLIEDEPENVLFLGIGSARFASGAVAGRLRGAGVHASAEYPSSDSLPPPGPGTLVIAVSVGGADYETAAALEPYAERSPIVVLCDDPGSAIARHGDIVAPLLAGGGDSGLACSAYQHALALLLMLSYRLGAAPSGSTGNVSVILRRVANATAGLIETQGEWLPAVSEHLSSADGLHLVAPAQRLTSAQQGALTVRKAPVLPAFASESAEWSHVDRYLAAVHDYRALLFTGSTYDERMAEQLQQLGGTVVTVGGEVAGAAHSVRYPGDADPDVALLAEVAVVELLAAHWWHKR